MPWLLQRVHLAWQVGFYSLQCSPVVDTTDDFSLCLSTFIYLFCLFSLWLNKLPVARWLDPFCLCWNSSDWDRRPESHQPHPNFFYWINIWKVQGKCLCHSWDFVLWMRVPAVWLDCVFCWDSCTRSLLCLCSYRSLWTHNIRHLCEGHDRAGQEGGTRAFWPETWSHRWQNMVLPLCLFWALWKLATYLTIYLNCLLVQVWAA